MAWVRAHPSPKRPSPDTVLLGEVRTPHTELSCNSDKKNQAGKTHELPEGLVSILKCSVSHVPQEDFRLEKSCLRETC